MKTKATSSKSKPFKIVGIILAFIVLASMFQVLLFVFFFLSVFVLIFRAMIKQKEKTGSWPVKIVPPRSSSFNESWSPLIKWNRDPTIRGNAGWHSRQPFRLDGKY
jgi:hypothetical protein